MNQRALSTVLLRVFAITYLFSTLTAVITQGQIDTSVLLHIGILLVGAYLFIHTFPSFSMSAFQWFKLQAAQTGEAYMSNANEALLKSGIKMVLIIFVLFRSRSICKFLSRYSKKLPQDIQQRALNKLRLIATVTQVDTLRIPPSNQLEALVGDRKGQYSIRINQQWRICF